MNIALIPARSGSKRIHGKNFMDFCGKPLVDWSVIQAINSSLIDNIVVSTDNLEYSPINPCVILPRPNNFCTDTTTQEEVISHAIESLKLEEYDNIILLQPTSPLRLPGDIDGCIENRGMSVNFEDDLFLWSETHDPVTFKFQLRDKGIFYRENGSVYVINVGDFKITKSRYPRGFSKFTRFQKWQQFEIDEPSDVPIVEYFMRKMILKEEI